MKAVIHSSFNTTRETKDRQDGIKKRMHNIGRAYDNGEGKHYKSLSHNAPYGFLKTKWRAMTAVKGL